MDLRGDGQVDIVTTSSGYSSGTVAVLLGRSDGTFADSPAMYNVGGSPTAVALGDFNHDGRLDIATANSSNSTVSVLLGWGDGTIRTQQTYAVGSDPQALVAG